MEDYFDGRCDVAGFSLRSVPLNSDQCIYGCRPLCLYSEVEEYSSGRTLRCQAFSITEDTPQMLLLVRSKVSTFIIFLKL